MKINLKLGLTLLSLVVGLVALYFIASWALPRVLVTFTKAAPLNRVSIKDSLVIGAKILAKADNKDSCLVNVFLMDENGKGVSNKRVGLVGVSNLIISSNNNLTDKDGKVSFNIKSAKEGQFKLVADIDGIEMPKGIIVTFRN